MHAGGIAPNLYWHSFNRLTRSPDIDEQSTVDALRRTHFHRVDANARDFVEGFPSPRKRTFAAPSAGVWAW